MPPGGVLWYCPKLIFFYCTRSDVILRSGQIYKKKKNNNCASQISPICFPSFYAVLIWGELFWFFFYKYGVAGSRCVLIQDLAFCATLIEDPLSVFTLVDISQAREICLYTLASFKALTQPFVKMLTHSRLLWRAFISRVRPS